MRLSLTRNFNDSMVGTQRGCLPVFLPRHRSSLGMEKARVTQANKIFFTTRNALRSHSLHCKDHPLHLTLITIVITFLFASSFDCAWSRIVDQQAQTPRVIRHHIPSWRNFSLLLLPRVTSSSIRVVVITICLPFHLPQCHSVVLMK